MPGRPASVKANPSVNVKKPREVLMDFNASTARNKSSNGFSISRCPASGNRVIVACAPIHDQSANEVRKLRPMLFYISPGTQ